jgi:hypothetical protein
MLAALIAIPSLVFAAPVDSTPSNCPQKGGALVEYCCPQRGTYPFNHQPTCFIPGKDGVSTPVAPVPVPADNPYPKECGGEWGPDRGTYFSLCKVGDSFVEFTYLA